MKNFNFRDNVVKIIEKIKTSLYILIPILCILFWAFIALYKDNFTLIPAADFPTFYYVSQLIFTEPEQIYFLEVQPYTYTPFFAMIIFPMGFLTFEQAHWYYFFFILILTELSLVLFNQILILKNVSNRFHRFLYLIAISNGIVFIQMFDTLTGRIFTAFGLIWFLKREIKFRNLKKDLTDTKFIFTQMMIIIFTFGITLQYFFLVLLYVFHNIKFKEIFSLLQIKRYLLLVISFLIQNFLLIVIFFISPEAISNLLGGHWRGESSFGSSGARLTYSHLLEKRSRDPVDSITTTVMVLSFYFDLSGINISILLVSILIMSFITFIIHIHKNLKIETKFGIWAFFSLFFYTFTQNRYFVGLLPIIVLLFLNYEIKSEKNIIEFIKKNYLILTGLICIMVLYFLPPIHYLIRVFPFLMNIPISIMLFKFTYIYLILSIDFFLLYRKNRIDFVQINKNE
jgi:hypothetical protein